MSHLSDFLASYSHDPETFDFDKFKSEAEAASKRDESTADAKIRVQAQKLGEFEKSDVQLRAENYDLMMKTGTPVGDADNTSGGASGDTDGEKITIDDLLTQIREG
jgi:hypothetical protein